MATLQSHHHLLHCYSLHSPKLHTFRNLSLVKNTSSVHKKFGDLSASDHGFQSFCCFCRRSSEVEMVSDEEEIERPPFDINLAVILAGFAFEAYITPPENVAKREVDAADCRTLFLSETFLREIYDGQVFINLKKGSKFPALDPWGTSDPYVVFQLESQVVKSNVKWGTREPTWNEELTLNIKMPPNEKNLQIAAWDANLVTPHKRMGNAEISLECLCDGNVHEVMVDLEGMGGGGQIQLEVKYRSFDDVTEEENWWSIPLVTEFLRKGGFDSALRNAVGSDAVQARQFVQNVFGQLKSLKLPDDLDKLQTEGSETSGNPIIDHSMRPELESRLELPADGTSYKEDSSNGNIDNGQPVSIVPPENEASLQSDRDFWRNLSGIVNENVVQKLGLPIPENMKWDKFELLDRIGQQSQKIAETAYVESGLATAQGQDVSDINAIVGRLTMSDVQSTLIDIKKMTQDVLSQTDSILGGLMVLNATASEIESEAQLSAKVNTENNDSTKVDDDSEHSKDGSFSGPLDAPILDEEKAAEMKELFSSAESAMEAWALLATSLGHSSFVKSEFEKLCFLDNEATDTQVAIWRDSSRKRLVIAFRGTEQVRWKDLRTDLMLVPTGLNPERIGGDFKKEVQVHSGFLSAYDSVRTRILSLIKLVTGNIYDGGEQMSKWHVYVTGHSLGGALATLLALELSSSQLAKRGNISVTMYNFGSPRVGNRNFADLYNQKVKDSWRVINRRDIIPTIPRLMGYCHVAQPIYLATRYMKSALENLEPLEDGYEADVIGESTPDALVNEFIKGEKELLDKILSTEINIFRSIRDGTAVMQHMEDFYYITLLEHVRSNYQTVATSKSSEEGNGKIYHQNRKHWILSRQVIFFYDTVFNQLRMHLGRTLLLWHLI
ncbi:Fungal lipase-like [Heracleum sosnowskyi]|uniref:Fungal lipase-like n=1 Tax=Heracleum sosnowskyi TaxID=360622 RepID=A0AAD8IS84_9APIA|nr:Fungal lipase-like [Heracleum sosnowskyi]